MTQEDVRRLLDELGGQATVEDISTRAKEKFPNRSLHTYVGQLLRRLEKKGFVSEDRNKAWRLTKKGKSTSIGGVEVSEVEEEVDESTLNENGLEVANLVGTLQADREFDLNVLAGTLSEAEYHPESSPFLVYRPIESATLLIPTNGLISIVGAKTTTQLKQAVQSFFDRVTELGMDIKVELENILIQNIVVKGDLKKELDLDVLSVGIGLERCEYEPEQFPGIIFRAENESTILIFRTGSYLINGCKSYAQVLESDNYLVSELEKIGVDI